MAKIIETPFISSCDCCGRTIYELGPFSKLGNPKVTKEYGDAVLVKSMRPLVAPDKEVDRIWKKFYGRCRTNADFKKARAKLVQKYGQKKSGGDRIYFPSLGYFLKRLAVQRLRDPKS